MSRPTTPASALHSATPASYLGSDPYGASAADHTHAGGPQGTSVLSQSTGVHDDQLAGDGVSGVQDSHMSQSQTYVPSRGGTLKKKSSLRRSTSKKSNYAGSVKSLKLGEKEKYQPTGEENSAFYCPVPTSGNPTELLADRFQGKSWRKVLKDLITYFRDLQKSYETRAKTSLSASNLISNTSFPSNFMTSGGLGDATHILRDFHKLTISEGNKARDLENEVIMQLTGLRSDLQQKIKEIKSLSGDFKNSVGKEQEGTRKAVRALQDALGGVDHDASTTAGRGDPFLVKMGVDRQLERQIEEENYLHRAYLNLEASGRELETIVIGEIQKAYNVLAGILRRDADQSYDVAEKLREGPLAMPKDYEWDNFVSTNEHMVNPTQPIRQVKQITYAGKDHPAATEVRSGMLERKSKYLKNYTPGWYILSPTHLHEFKSADKIAFQQPIMSLYLPEQKIGSQSEPNSSSHKFMLKGRQTGSMHRGHTWIFRAETHDTMMAWVADIKELTEKRGEARNEFVRRSHARSVSANSLKAASIRSSESGMEEDEADKVAFSGEQSIRGVPTGTDGAGGLEVIGGGAIGTTAGAYDESDERSVAGWRPQRPAPGGRFPSDLNVQRGLQAPLSPSSEGNNSEDRDRDTIAAAGALPGSSLSYLGGTEQKHANFQPQSHSENDYVNVKTDNVYPSNTNDYTTGQHSNVYPTSAGVQAIPASEFDNQSNYGQWMAPVAAGMGGATLGGVAAHHYTKEEQLERQGQNIAQGHGMGSEEAIPGAGQSSAPIGMATLPDHIEPASTPAPAADPTPVPAPVATTVTTAESSVVSLASTTPEAVTVSTIETDKSLFDANGTYVGPRTASTAPTEYTMLPSRPAFHHAKSVMTISDLHVPGEFPLTPSESVKSPQLSSEVYLRD